MNRFISPAIVLSVFLLDRLSKARALDHLFGRPVQVLPFFQLTYAENTGVAFGMFHGNNIFFIVVSVGLITALLFFRKRIQGYGLVAGTGLSLVLAGALGNLYDRIAYGFVVDFFDFSFFPAVFNVADSSITAGAFLMAFGIRDTGKEGAAGRA